MEGRTATTACTRVLNHEEGGGSLVVMGECAANVGGASALPEKKQTSVLGCGVFGVVAEACGDIETRQGEQTTV